MGDIIVHVFRPEVRAFYDENPALFAQRRIYRLRELGLEDARLTEIDRDKFYGVDEAIGSIYAASVA